MELLNIYNPFKDFCSEGEQTNGTVVGGGWDQGNCDENDPVEDKLMM